MQFAAHTRLKHSCSVCHTISSFALRVPFLRYHLQPLEDDRLIQSLYKLGDRAPDQAMSRPGVAWRRCDLRTIIWRMSGEPQLRKLLMRLICSTLTVPPLIPRLPAPFRHHRGPRRHPLKSSFFLLMINTVYYSLGANIQFRFILLFTFITYLYNLLFSIIYFLSQPIMKYYFIYVTYLYVIIVFLLPTLHP